MKKIKINLKWAKRLDWLFWIIAVLFAFWADWRIGVALLAFDVMRAFEDIQKYHELGALASNLERRIIKAVASVIKLDCEEERPTTASTGQPDKPSAS